MEIARVRESRAVQMRTPFGAVKRSSKRNQAPAAVTSGSSIWIDEPRETGKVR